MHGLVLILGGRGSGKTCLLQRIEREHRSARRRFVVWDSMGFWRPEPNRIVTRTGDAEEAAALAIQHAPCTWLVDEAADAYGNKPKAGSALWEVARKGRQPRAVGPWKRKGPVAAILASQRPVDIHPDMRSMIDVLILGAFPSTAGGDLEWIAETAKRMGLDPREVVRSAVESPRLSFRVYQAW